MWSYEWICYCTLCKHMWEELSSYAPCLCPECQEDDIEILEQYAYG